MPGNCQGKNSVMENYWWNCRLINYYQYFLHLLLELPVIFLHCVYLIMPRKVCCIPWNCQGNVRKFHCPESGYCSLWHMLLYRCLYFPHDSSSGWRKDEADDCFSTTGSVLRVSFTVLILLVGCREGHQAHENSDTYPKVYHLEEVEEEIQGELLRSSSTGERLLKRRWYWCAGDVWLGDYLPSLCVWIGESSSVTRCGSSVSHGCHVPPGSGTLLHYTSQSVTSKPRDVPNMAAGSVVRRRRCVWMHRLGSVDAVAGNDRCQYDVTSADGTTDSCTCREFRVFCFHLYYTFPVITDQLLLLIILYFLFGLVLLTSRLTLSIRKGI